LKKLVHLTAAHEDGVWAATGTKNRQRGCWARSIRPDFRTLRYEHGARDMGHPAADRYHVLNLSNLVMNAKPTVEFRAFGGTVNAGKVLAYVRLCLALVERALEAARARQFDAAPLKGKSPMLRKGSGYTALTRLLYEIGWVKGRRDRAYGAVGAGEAGLPDVEASKAQLRRLAKKYDASV
jgi:putative amidoligase enzyme